ncbi:MAG: zinc finger domain-containing protein [Rudaea sp.]
MGPDALEKTIVEFRETRFAISESRSENPKCIRCWHHRPDVGVNPAHPEICGRCVTNLPDGPGENRQYF